jgi:hypothetical protein
MATTHSQLLMLSETNSLTPTKVSVNGGKLKPLKNTGLIKSSFLTEKTAAEKDSQEPKFSLVRNYVDQFKMEHSRENGMKSNVPNHSSVRKLES